MKYLKNFLIFIISSLLVVIIPIFIFSLAIVPTIINKASVKELASSQQTYDALVDTIKTANITDYLQPDTNINEQDDKQFKTDQTALFKIIDEVIPYEKYQQLSDDAIDDVYRWLEGETEQPEIEIVLASNSKEAIKLLEPAFVKKYESLEPCPDGFVVPPDFSPLSSECRLNGTDENTVRQYLDESAEDPDFDELFSEISFNTKDTEPLTTEQSEFVQDNYARMKLIPFTSGLSSVILLVILALLLKTKSRISKSYGLIFIVSSLPILISALFTKFLPLSTIESIINRSNPAVSASKLIEILLEPITNKLLIYSGITLFIGLVLLIISRYFRRKAKASNLVPPIVIEQNPTFYKPVNSSDNSNDASNYPAE